MPKGIPKSERRRAAISVDRAERLEFTLWKKYFGLPKLDPNDKDTKLRRDYVRWFLKLEIREMYYLFRVGPKLLKGTPVAPYEPKLKRRRPRKTVETEDGSTITEL